MMHDIETIGAEVNGGESILKVLERLKDRDFEARKAFLVKRLRDDLVWVNRGAIPYSMSSYLLVVDKLIQSLKLDEHAENGFVKRLYRRCSNP